MGRHTFDHPHVPVQDRGPPYLARSVRMDTSSRDHGYPAPASSRRSGVDVIATADAVRRNVEQVIEGKPDVVRVATTVLFAGGHLLVEDVPGVGKTVLAKALARSVDASLRRIQFTPDLLPSDITGVTIYDQTSGEFRFRPGAVFANVVIGDEINRASPKTQAALLEAMEEHQVTIDGTTRALPDPFMVVATQNPVEMDGTFPLPEAQRDRFTAQVSMGYPSPRAEFDMLEHHGVTDPLSVLRPVTSAAEIAACVGAISRLHTSEALRQYVVDVVSATREHPSVRLGASPRASLQLLRAARAHAALAGRDHVIPEDVTAMAPAVLGHRVLLRRGRNDLSASEVVADVIADVRVPTQRASR